MVLGPEKYEVDISLYYDMLTFFEEVGYAIHTDWLMSYVDEEQLACLASTSATSCRQLSLPEALANLTRKLQPSPANQQRFILYESD